MFGSKYRLLAIAVILFNQLHVLRIVRSIVTGSITIGICSVVMRGRNYCIGRMRTA